MAQPLRPISPHKVAIYIRWSTEDQREGTTLEVQLEGCSHYLLAQGWQVNEALIFIDDGYSGGSLERPAMARLREAVGNGAVDCVVVFKIDRLSRNVIDTVNLVLKEWDGRCHLKSAREPIDTAEPAGRMFFYTLVSFAEWERSTIRDRTFSGRVRRAQEGRHPGGRPPYGYELGEKPGQVVLARPEAEIVRRIFRQFCSGASTRAIAGALNGEGIPSATGRSWDFTYIAKLLSNPAYTGALVYGRVTRLTGDRPAGTPRVVQNEKPLAMVEGALPVIIPRADFDRVQAIKQKRPGRHAGGSGRAYSSPYLLSGLLTCGICGDKIRARPPYGSSPAYYYCLGRFAKGVAHCRARPFIRQSVLDDAVALHMRTEQTCSARRAAYLREHLTCTAEQIDSTARARDRVLAALTRLEREQAHIRKQFRSQAVSAAEFRRLAADIDQEAAQARKRLRSLEESLQVLRAAPVRRKAVMSALGALDHWADLDPLQRKRVLNFLVERVVVTFPADGEPACEIWWRTSGPLTTSRPECGGTP